jgi:NADP-dependent 3-hydroxy acid dehydrogenase YdfG/acyl carrier protein
VFFVPKAGVGEDAVGLVRAVRARVAASLGAAPNYVVPMAAGDFPKTTSGKIQRARLKQALEAGEFQEALKALDVALENSNTVPDWFYRRTWRPRAKPSGPPRRSGGKKTVVLLDGSGLGVALAERENRYGRPWVEVETGPAFEKLDEDRYRLDPGSPADYRRLLASVAADGIGVEEVVHLWTYGANPGEIADADSLEAAQERGACSLLFLLQALAAERPPDQPVRVTVASSHAQPVLPTDPVACEQGPLLGLLRTAPKEWPWLECHHVDLPADDLEADADAVLRELRAVRADEEVAYRDGHRWVPRLEHVDLRDDQARPLPFERGGLYLVTGGLGGVAGAIARHLLEMFDAKLLLVGRTSLPETQVTASDAHSETSAKRVAAYRALEQLGGEVLYRSADVADSARLRCVVAEAEARWGRALDGIIHLAGVFEERLLAEETRETFMASLRPKLHGLWTLHKLAKDRPDCGFITFSSAYGLLGVFGAGAYAAANSFLDGFAHYRRRAGLPSACFAWSEWDAVGMAGDLPLEKQKLLRARGFLPISPEQGVNSLLASLQRDQAHLLVGLDATRPYIGRRVEQSAESTHTLRAYFTARNGPVSTVRSEVRDRFGTPSACDLVRVPELPLTEPGAIDRSRLAEAAQGAAADDSARLGSEASFAEPRTPTEAELARIWADLLKLDQVGVGGGFFELGGSSLLAVRAVMRLNRRFGVELPVRALFEAPTVAGLALAVTRTAAEAPAFPLSLGQKNLWSHEQLVRGHAAPNGTPALRLRGSLDVTALKVSLEEICVRHEALRTTFHTRNGEPVQRVRLSRSVPLPRVDLRELPPSARETEAARLLAREAQRPFDLARDSMLRAMLVRLAENEHVLLLVIHHLACDGWSLDVLVRELQALYGAVRSGQRADLPELSVQYADYAVWQRERLQDGALRESVEYWKKQWAGAPKALAIPRDRRGPPAGASEQRFIGAWQELRMPGWLVQELHTLRRPRSASLFTTLLTAWVTLLHRYSGQDDILIFTPFANRRRVEVEGLIGFFATNLALRHSLGGDPSFGELLGRVRATVLDAFSHDELPYAEFPEEVRPTPQSSFFLRSVPQDGAHLGSLGVERIDFEIETGEASGFLSLVMREGHEGLTARLFYHPDLFEAATAAGMLRYLQTVLEGVVADPERKLSELPLPIRASESPPIRPVHARVEGPQSGRRLGRVSRRARKRLRGAVRRARREMRRPALLARRVAGRVRAKL